MGITIISAGAGSGKTHRLTHDMAHYLDPKNGFGVRAEGIFATTFTNKAAAELQDRVRVKLLEEGLTEQADALGSAMIGTVHSLGVKLLKRFAFEAGVSPQVGILAEEDKKTFFNQALSSVLKTDTIAKLNRLAEQLSIEDDWRTDLQTLCDAARGNNFTLDDLTSSCAKSINSLFEFLPEVSKKTPVALTNELLAAMRGAIQSLKDNEADSTKVTSDAVTELQKLLNLAKNRPLYWSEWAKIAKLKVSKKSELLLLDLQEAANEVETHPHFQDDLRCFISLIFDVAKAAITEYQRFKTARGLIDYTDMEVSILSLLQNQTVCEVLKDELDLLLVDEFQDTNPIQLAIFLKLSELAKIAVWVGDPKQSIYGFRGSDPQLMDAVVQHLGGVKSENILSNSWRSRADLVHATNALFCKAFSETPKEQVALRPVRRKMASDCTEPYHQYDHLSVESALWHWHFKYEGSGQSPKGWLQNCIADRVRATLQAQIAMPNGSNNARPIRPSDIAVLCRTNFECLQVAEALNNQGIKAAIAQVGLLQTPEIKLVLACLKYILQRQDTVSAAELLRLGLRFELEDIVLNRLDYLDKQEHGLTETAWAADQFFLQKLAGLRTKVAELSSYEILTIILEELDLRRIVAGWGNLSQRLNNIDALRKIVVGYETTCNRLQTAASLGGMLLHLSQLATDKRDEQGVGNSNEAVQVLTYHKSKGLEWSMTVCMGLEGALRDRIWGINIVSERSIFDINDPLGGRWLRYWQHPYGKQLQNTPLDAQISVSNEKNIAVAQALAEDARLLYVGLTRARDYLVLPTREKKATNWLNRIFHNGNDALPTLSTTDAFTPFEWEGKQVAQRLEIYSFPSSFGRTESTETNTFFRARRAGKSSFEPYYIDTTKPLPQKLQATEPVIFAQSILLPDEIDNELFLKSVYAFLNYDNIDYDNAPRRAAALRLLNPVFDSLDELEQYTDLLLNQSAHFFERLKQETKNAVLSRNMPIYDTVGGRKRYRGNADIFVKTKKGAIIIKHALSTDLSQSHIRAFAETFSTELYFQRSAVAAVEGIPLQDIRLLVHFPTAGFWIKMH